MAIGVFDSGVGGLTVHRALVRRLPEADFVYLSDGANCPYGGRPGEEIVALTRAGCERLFAEGADLVVLAGNTASAVALRRLQQTWLPGLRRGTGKALNVLGIIAPTVEAATGRPWSHALEPAPAKVERVDVVGVFSTPATAASRVFEIEIDKRREDVAAFSEPCPDLAQAVEEGADREALRAQVARHVAALRSRIGRHPDRAILGCTHYELIADLFAEALPAGTPLIHQPQATADALAGYLRTHPEYAPGGSGQRRFLTTGRAGLRGGLVEAFCGEPLKLEAA